MPTLSYLTTTHFDFGAVAKLGKELARIGITRPLFVTDKGVRAAGLLDKVLAAAGDADTSNVYDDTPPNPTEAATLVALAQYEAGGCNGVVCVGGGSPMDLGKGVALLAGSGLPLVKYDPSAGGARNIGKVAPLVAIPTTAGTGSEVSIGAVIILEDGRKVGFGPKLIPTLAICDPELTLGLPPLMTAATGMDAITHCIEAVLSPIINPPAEGVGYDGLWRGWRNLRTAVKDGSDRTARWEMMMASTEGAMAFVKGLGAVHAMSHSAGRLPEKKLHHGTLNAVTLPAVLRFNQSDATAEKYERLRLMMGLKPGTDLAEAIEQMNADIGLPANLKAMGVTTSDMDDLIKYATLDLSGRTNPRETGADDYRKMFEESLG